MAHTIASPVSLAMLAELSMGASVAAVVLLEESCVRDVVRESCLVCHSWTAAAVRYTAIQHVVTCFGSTSAVHDV